ncbi:hypothetical protein [Pseudarthrobacter sulfonivorans]|uniref:hypothetical protein n=1 Tax=Pseudarthrobacter sulfonivorans TaxID=121292 RepID=UPI00210354B6|nr:hypothetical protein [Pseudarthrobacter sulfonivorans]
MFFWIIILAFVVPAAMRMYRKSVNKRNQGQGFFGSYPGQPGQYPGPQSRQPRDGYTQQDYMSGGYREIMSPQPLPPAEPLPPMQPIPPANQQFPGQQFPPYGQPQQYGEPQQYGQPGQFSLPGQFSEPQQYGQPGQFSQPGQRPEAANAQAAPATPPPPSAPQGYRARKLAELDQQYSNGELAMEDYMKRRADIMNG